MRKELDAIDAVLEDDERAAATIMVDMTPEELHELMRACLVTTSLARQEILGAGHSAGNSIRDIHRDVEAILEAHGITRVHPEGRPDS